MAEFGAADAAAKKTSRRSPSSSSVSTTDGATGGEKRRRNNSPEYRQKKKRRSSDKAEGVNGSQASSMRRPSLSKAARDPRDEPELPWKKPKRQDGKATRTPSPVIDFDGLSRPSKIP